MNNISKGTIVRTITLIFVLVNLLLKALGKPLIDIDESTIFYWFEFALEIGIIVVGFWKNNSFSKAAIKADEFLRNLKKGEAENLTFETQIEENETIIIETEETEDVESI